MKIALLQIDTIPEKINQNLEKIISWSRKVAEAKAEIAVFHEVALTDYVSDVTKYAEEVPNGESCQTIKKLADELGIYISFGLIEKSGESFYITYVFFGPQNFFYKYRKTNLHIPKNMETAIQRYRDEESYFTRGNGPDSFTIINLKAACILCADANSDQVMKQVFALKPDIVFFPNNRVRWRPDEFWGGIAKKLDAPIFVSNRVGESWGFSSPGGASVYDKNGACVKKANLEGKEEMLIVDWRE